MDRGHIETLLSSRRQKRMELRAEIAKLEGGIEALEELLSAIGDASLAAAGAVIEKPSVPKPRPTVIDATGGGARSAGPR